MPPPSNEQDLKRRARRRLIGAVALTLLAVIVLPLLLEDEPPPASSLDVKMATAPDQPVTAPEPVKTAAPEPAAPEPITPAPEPDSSGKPETKPEAKVQPRIASKPATAESAASPRADIPAAKPAAETAFVVQLAALSDAGKARALAARASQAGLPAYTDVVGKLTRVRLGPYATREAAVAAAVKLAENGMSGQVVAK
ncbi:MAG: SPOR domain-containing protein [Pseudomonadota bacterium]